MRPYFNQSLVDRLQKLINYQNPATAYFSIRNFPQHEAKWGKPGVGRQDRSDILCIRDKPVTLWIVAELIFPNFTYQGNPNRRAGVRFRPLLDDDLKTASRMLNALCKPIICEYYNITFLIKVTQRSRNSQLILECLTAFGHRNGWQHEV